MPLLRLGFVVLFGAFFTGGLLALRQNPAPSSGNPPAALRETPAETRRPRPRGFVGEVVSVSPAESRFTARETLNDGSPKTTQFQTTPQTRIVCGKESCSLADVKVNDHVTVKYADTPSGQRKALTVRITPAAKPKTAK